MVKLLIENCSTQLQAAHSRNNAPSLGVELVCGAVAHTVALVLPGMELDLPDLLSAH